MPKASFIGFTSTPIESGDKNTQAVFDDLAAQARHQLVSNHDHSRLRAPWSLMFTTSCNQRKTRPLCRVYYEARLAPVKAEGVQAGDAVGTQAILGGLAIQAGRLDP